MQNLFIGVLYVVVKHTISKLVHRYCLTRPFIVCNEYSKLFVSVVDDTAGVERGGHVPCPRRRQSDTGTCDFFEEKASAIRHIWARCNGDTITCIEFCSLHRFSSIVGDFIAWARRHYVGHDVLGSAIFMSRIETVYSPGARLSSCAFKSRVDTLCSKVLRVHL